MNVLVKHKRILTIINVIILSMVVFVYHLGLLTSVPFWAFLVFCTIVFGVTLYRPIMAFAIFVGVLPLEIINVAPDVIGFSLRPYQVIVVAMFLGMIGAIMLRTNIRKRFSWSLLDTLIAILLSIGLANALIINSQDIWIQTVIFLSFGLLYFITRFFIGERKEVIALFPIMISSGVVVSVYAIVQNLLFAFEKFHLEIMPGRPNATFAESDWLGMYLVFVFSVCLVYLYYNAAHKHLWRFFDIALYVSTFLIFTALILTVARSAWLGAAAVLGVYFLALMYQKKYKLFARHFLWTTSLSVLSIGLIFAFDLTTFELGNRVQSTGSGRQEITVSCVSSVSRDALVDIGHIVHVSELGQYDCRHIDLEEIQSEEKAGRYVIKVYRDDPNVSVRSDVYKESIAAITKQPVIGYGWGRSGEILGTDEAGTSLNASNMFLETALSIGVVGASALGVFFCMIFYYSVRILHVSKSSINNSLALFGLLGFFAILVPNMFNAGLLMGFVWVWFGMVAILRKML